MSASIKIADGGNLKKKNCTARTLDRVDMHHMTYYNTLNHYTTAPCSDTCQALPYGLDSVRASHQACCKFLTENVRTTSGRRPKFSQNLFRPSSGSVTYIQGSWHSSGKSFEPFHLFFRGGFFLTKYQAVLGFLDSLTTSQFNLTCM